MKEKITDKQEGALINILNEISPLEWAKFGHKFVLHWETDHLEPIYNAHNPPFIAFRFENESEEIINKLRFLINNYSGKVKWEIYAHKRELLPGTNWVIRPLRVSEVTTLAEKAGLVSAEYLAKNEPTFGPIAFDDLNDLTKYIQDNFI